MGATHGFLGTSGGGGGSGGLRQGPRRTPGEVEKGCKRVPKTGKVAHMHMLCASFFAISWASLGPPLGDRALGLPSTPKKARGCFERASKRFPACVLHLVSRSCCLLLFPTRLWAERPDQETCETVAGACEVGGQNGGGIRRHEGREDE